MRMTTFFDLFRPAVHLLGSIRRTKPGVDPRQILEAMAGDEWPEGTRQCVRREVFQLLGGDVEARPRLFRTTALDLEGVEGLPDPRTVPPGVAIVGLASE